MSEKDKPIVVRIRLLGFLEPYANSGNVTLEASVGCTVEEIILNMVSQLGEDFRLALLDSHGNLNGGIEVVLDGEHISPYQLSSRFFYGDSELILFPMIAGGSIDAIIGITEYKGDYYV